MNQSSCRDLVKARAKRIWEDSLGSWVDLASPMCELDNCSPITEMHHRLNRSQGGKWVPSNIIGLSSRCHSKVTVRPAWANEMGLHLRPWQDPLTTPVKVWYSQQPVLFDDEGNYHRIDTEDQPINDG
jgi:5-methylcytosine-specific restriction endonuclease McrA